MSSDITFNVKIDTSKIEQLAAPGAIENKAAPVVKKWAFVIEGDTKESPTMPLLTGFLKGSIQAKEKTIALWEIADGTEYGIFQELGTRFMAGKFFLTGACEKNANPFFDDLVKIFS